jgi:hypothetical protein
MVHLLSECKSPCLLELRHHLTKALAYQPTTRYLLLRRQGVSRGVAPEVFRAFSSPYTLGLYRKLAQKAREAGCDSSTRVCTPAIRYRWSEVEAWLKSQQHVE